MEAARSLEDLEQETYAERNFSVTEGGGSLEVRAADDHGHTVEEIYALPDGQRAELVDGKWYDMASPGSVHQRLVALFTYELMRHIREKGGDCEVFPSPFAVFLDKDDKTYLEPDVCVICDPEKVDEKGCQGAPDLVIEIVSPSSKRMDYWVKLWKYHAAGVKEYWIVDPSLRVTIKYRLTLEEEIGGGEGVSFTEEIHSYLFPEFGLRLADTV